MRSSNCGADRVIFGSDWPHIEGMPQPLDYSSSSRISTPSNQAGHARQRLGAQHAPAAVVGGGACGEILSLPTSQSCERSLTSAMSDMSIEEIRAGVEAWLDENWDESLTVGDWWDRLGPSRYAHPMLGTNAYGKGLTQAQAAAVMATMADREIRAAHRTGPHARRPDHCHPRHPGADRRVPSSILDGSSAGAGYSPSPVLVLTLPASPARPRRTVTSTSSPARRSGPPARSPTWAC